jgi:hypothetical protein
MQITESRFVTKHQGVYVNVLQIKQNNVHIKDVGNALKVLKNKKLPALQQTPPTY